MDKNNTKLTDEEFDYVLEHYNGVLTVQIKRSLEGVINAAYKVGFEDGVKSVKSEKKDGISVDRALELLSRGGFSDDDEEDEYA